MTALRQQRTGEEGYLLLGLIVAIFLILLTLSIAAPRVAKELRRERELEAVHRGQQYVRAIQVYYRKNGTYPNSIEQLQKSNNIRYLRQRYADPMTGKANWRIIHVGEAKTTVKGFFGKPLSGVPASGGLGSLAGQASNMGGSSNMSPTGSSFGTSSFAGSSGSSGSGFSLSSTPATGTGTPGTPGTPTGSTGSSSSSGFSSLGSGVSSQSATSFQGGGAPIMGVGSAATGSSIIVLNEQTTYPTWEFIYDPRIEQLKPQTAALGNSIGSTPATSFGAPSTGSGFGSPSSPGSSPTSPSSGFGSSSFGSGSSFGTGSTFGSGAGTPTTPQ